MKVKLFVICCLTFVITATAVAVPQYINYQGVLRDASGNLVIGTKQMTFKIYDASSGGTELFSMTSPEVAVTNGLYTVKIGALGTDVLGTGQRWLEVAVGTDTLSPRLEILSAAYAINATSAESAAKLGGYAAASTGASIIPITDNTGKLNSSVIPDASITVSSASYAVLSGTASNAATVDDLSASSTATASQLLALDANKQLKGMSVSAEASGNNYALFANGKIGAEVCTGSGTVPTGGVGVSVPNSVVTANSIILLSVGPGDDANQEAVKISDITPGTGFTVKAVDGTMGVATPFRYIIIN